MSLNDDGSINVKLSEQQIRSITPPSIQNINLEEIRGVKAAFEKVKESEYGYQTANSLKTCTCK